MAENEEMQKFESITISLPPLKTVLGDIPVPDPPRARELPKRIYTKQEIVERLIMCIMEK